MKRKVFLIFLINCNLFVLNCLSVPFFIKDNGNMFIELYDENEKYRFAFDTGSNLNVFYKNGFEKAKKRYTFDIEEELYKVIKERNQGISDENARRYVKQYIDEYGLTFELSNLKSEDFCFPSQKFIYSPKIYKNFDKSDFDGVVGLVFFNNIKNITINYQENLLIINDTNKISNSVKLDKFPSNNLYKIKISIDGIYQDALIDTGSMHFFIRPEYKTAKEYSEEELINILDIDNDIYKVNDSEKEVTITIGDFSKKIIGFFFDDQKYNCTKTAESFVRKINILGNNVFVNHIIQLDFENMEFRIE